MNLPPTCATWRKSSYSTATGNCVEVASTAHDVVIRHSKHPTTGTITIPNDAWAAFLHDAARDAPTSTNGIVTISKTDTDTLVRSRITQVEIRFDQDEWTAFTAGVADGEFDLAAA